MAQSGGDMVGTCGRRAAGLRQVKQRHKNFDQYVAARPSSDGDVPDVYGQLSSESMDWSDSRSDWLTVAMRGGE